MKTKKLFTVLISTVLIASPIQSIPIQAAQGGWKQSGSLYWYLNPDGTYPKNTWKKINGFWYAFDSHGWMKTGWQKIGNDWYYLGAKNDGAMKTGWIYTGGHYYYLGQSGKMKTGWIRPKDTWYYLCPNGSMASNTVIDGCWLNEEGAWMEHEVQLDSGGKLIQEALDNLHASCPTPMDIFSAVYECGFAKEMSVQELDKSLKPYVYYPDNAGNPVLTETYYALLEKLGYNIDAMAVHTLDTYVEAGYAGEELAAFMTTYSGFPESAVRQAFLKKDLPYPGR